LVAGELEARWNRALAKVAETEGRIAAHDAARPATNIDPAALGLLASDLRAVWSAPTTDARLKKRIARTLIHEVIADIDDATSEIVLIVHPGPVEPIARFACRSAGEGSATAPLPMLSQRSGNWC
jgi:hypothetical protein